MYERKPYKKKESVKPKSNNRHPSRTIFLPYSIAASIKELFLVICDEKDAMINLPVVSFIILFTVSETSFSDWEKPSFSMFVESHKESKTFLFLNVSNLSISHLSTTPS